MRPSELTAWPEGISSRPYEPREANMTRLFRYILKDDKGMAPCVEDGIMTLATCKPKIRRSAKMGDWIAGFMPRPHKRGLLVYAGRVARILDWGQYEAEFRGRKDAVYRKLPNGGFKRLRDDYHADKKRMKKDLCGPVVVFDEKAFWYFGGNPEELPDCLRHLAASVRDYQVKGAKEDDEKRLEKWLRSKHKHGGVHGEPRDGGTCSSC